MVSSMVHFSKVGTLMLSSLLAFLQVTIPLPHRWDEEASYINFMTSNKVKEENVATTLLSLMWFVRKQ